MLTLPGRPQRFCDGVSRRNFLQIGSFALGSAGGLSLADLLRAECTERNRGQKAVISVFLGGGPPHQDMWEIKTRAPVEIRGEFKPISTSVPGIQICECFPRIAAMMDRFAVIRSVVGCSDGHDAYQCFSGWSRQSLRSIGGRPSIGSVLAKFRGAADPGIPASIALAAKTQHVPWSEPGSPGFLGFAWAPFRPNGDEMAELTPGNCCETGSRIWEGEAPAEPAPRELPSTRSDPTRRRMFPDPYREVASKPAAAAQRELRPPTTGRFREPNDSRILNGVTLDRLTDRKTLLKGMDDLNKSVEASGRLDGMDAFTQTAFGVLNPDRLAAALDISQESPETRARYGDGKPYNYQYDGAPTCNEHFLIARRLVEAGVRSVTLSYGRWDSHAQNFALVRDHGPKLDQAVTALVQDLEDRNMLDDVTVVVWGEFGRTPRVNRNAGRDHWPQVSCALLAGGGMNLGLAIGSTNRLGEHAVDRPVDMLEIVATIYHNLGIDPMTTTVVDPAGRSRHLVDRREPIRELI